MTPEIPLSLRHALESGRCVLFLGAGVGFNLYRPDGSRAPTGAELAEQLAKHFGIDAGESHDLAQISQAVELRKGRKELEVFLKSSLAHLTPDPAFKWLFNQRWAAIYTTNYDNAIELAYELNPKPLQTPLSFSVTQDLRSFEPQYEVPVIHLHGRLFGPDIPKIIITEDDYARFRDRRSMLFELLKRDAATTTILYIGYSHRDPNWRLVRDEMVNEFLPNTPPPAYRVDPRTPPLEIEILKARGIESIATDLDGFVKAATASLAEASIDAANLAGAAKLVPSELSHAFTLSPPATLRLLQSWDYINQAPFNEKPNTYNFLRGDRANWAQIASQGYFVRDLEEEMHDNLLDFATNDEHRPIVNILVGPAGFGVSTLLYTLAAKLVHERAGQVFFLRPESAVHIGDVEFVATLDSTRRVFLFVDDASEQRGEVEDAIRRLKDLRAPAMFILGSRLNEWRQAGGPTLGSEFELEELSDQEIERLIAFLDAANELGILKELSHELRTAAIRNKHGKQLLVAMRESTEGTGFDAIIEDEYRRIGNTKSQLAYLATCAFSQHGTYLRDDLLARCLGFDRPTLYACINSSTEGVIIFDVIDKYRGIYGARARHRTIAEIVWIRCGDQAEKEQILYSVLSHLNLNHASDKSAFEELIRTDSLVDSIHSLEGKLKYFDTACRKDPDSPYVRQHYARMLSRETKFELALSQIEEAIRLGPKVRVLYHSKGKILSDFCDATQSEDMARRYQVRAENSFRQGLSMFRQDEYCYQGLAELYLRWAKRVNTDREAAEYIAKSEEIISEGLRVVRSKEGLRIVSAQIADHLGNEPKHVQALETAVRESPNSIVARYLLGRTYRKSNQPDRAVVVLQPLVADHPEEFRAGVDLALSLLAMHEPYSKAIAVLQLCNLHGFSDPRFIATLGGLQYLNGDLTEAELTFNRAIKLNLLPHEMNRVEFRPKNPLDDKSLKFSGAVIAVKSGYAFIECEGYPHIFLPGSKWCGVPIRRGLKVEFDIVFSAKGAQADRVKAIYSQS